MGRTRSTGKLLPATEAFCNGQIICRFLRAQAPKDLLIVAIPGGPGLSSIYLDPFMANLAERTGANVAVMDLPNHGASLIKEVTTPLSYIQCRGFVKKAVEEISRKTPSVVLFGQSFGARLTFDLLAELEMPPLAAFLTGFPYIFEISSALEAKLNELPLEPEEGPRAEEIHAENWRKILPLYTVQPVTGEVSEALATRVEVPGGHLMLQDVPPIEDVAKAINPTIPMVVIEAQLDPVVPDNNWNVLRSLLSDASFKKLENVGHFPMVEKPEEVLGAFSELIARSRRNVK